MKFWSKVFEIIFIKVNLGKGVKLSFSDTDTKLIRVFLFQSVRNLPSAIWTNHIATNKIILSYLQNNPARVEYAESWRRGTQGGDTMRDPRRV